MTEHAVEVKCIIREVFIMKNKIRIDDTNLSYFEFGKGKTILFLHGGRLRALTHKNILLKLANNYHILAPDIPGYGKSSTPKESWSFQDYATFFDKFLKRINMSEVIVVGYSLGGGIAYSLANVSPRVKKLVLIDSAGIEKTKENEHMRDLQRLFFYLSNPKYIFTFFTLIREYLLFTMKHSKNLSQIKTIRNNLNNSVGYMENLKVPTSIIWAKDNGIFPVSVAKKLNESIKSSKLFLVNGNHDWILYKENISMDILNKALI
ncbi:hypothetical protein B6D29_00135 [Microgenomates bacterium UTCPR1]|nr:MAG: hypothetical protein B6D29_00135 [Microgenomates bacterium UTCPR1]